MVYTSNLSEGQKGVREKEGERRIQETHREHLKEKLTLNMILLRESGVVLDYSSGLKQGANENSSIAEIWETVVTTRDSILELSTYRFSQAL